MRNVTLAIALAAAFALAPAAEACFRCSQYFDWQSSSWCWYCAATYCGLFNCDVYQHPTYGDYCDGEEGCFEVGRGCAFEPTLKLTDPKLESPRLAQTWRLVRVRVDHPKQRASDRAPVVLR